MMRKSWFKPVEAGWDPNFFERFFGTPLGAALRAREEEVIDGFLASFLEPHHSALEVGCGTGNYTVPIAQRCKKVVAIDSSPEMLQYLQERLSREGLTNVEAGLGRLPNGLGTPEKFDGALVIGVLNYAKDLEESLRALVSSLEPGGWAIFNAPPSTAEGRVYALSELVNRRRAYLLSPGNIVAAAEGAGLRVQKTAPAGLTRGGVTFVVGAVVPASSRRGPADTLKAASYVS